MNMRDEAEARKRAADETRKKQEATAAAALQAWCADVDACAKEYAVAARETGVKRHRVGLRTLWIVSVPIDPEGGEYRRSTPIGVKPDGSWVTLQRHSAPQSRDSYSIRPIREVVSPVPTKDIRAAFVNRL